MLHERIKALTVLVAFVESWYTACEAHQLESPPWGCEVPGCSLRPFTERRRQSLIRARIASTPQTISLRFCLHFSLSLLTYILSHLRTPRAGEDGSAEQPQLCRCISSQTLLLFSSLHISFHRLTESSEKKHSASNNFLGTPLTRQTLLAGALLSFPFLPHALFLSTCNWDFPWAVELTIFSWGFLYFFSSARTHLGWTVIMSLLHSLVAIWPRIQGMNLLKFRWVANASNTAHHRMSH